MNASRLPAFLLSAAAVLVSCLAPGCGRPAPASRAAPAKPWVKWNAEEFFTDRRAIALCKAIEAHNLREIERLVKSGVDVNAKGRGNMTPLLWAFPVGEDVFKKLLQLGADPNVRLTEKAWPLLFEKDTSVMSASASPLVVEAGAMHESYFGNVPMDNYLKLVLIHGGNPNIIVSDASRETPLFRLSLSPPNKVCDRIRVLIDAGADLDHRNYLGCTPIMFCPPRASTYLLCLLKAGADYRLRNQGGLDAVLVFEREKADLEQQAQEHPNNTVAKSELAAIQPARDWLANEGVNWRSARAALESRVDFKTLPGDYQHRPWLPQRPTLKKK